jgi:hypothetical protein
LSHFPRREWFSGETGLQTQRLERRTDAGIVGRPAGPAGESHSLRCALESARTVAGRMGDLGTAEVQLHHLVEASFLGNLCL